MVELRFNEVLKPVYRVVCRVQVLRECISFMLNNMRRWVLYGRSSLRSALW